MSTFETEPSPPLVIRVDVAHAPDSVHDHALADAAYNKTETFGTLGLLDTNPTTNGSANLDWILSEPLLAAALHQTTHLDHLTSLEASIQAALQNHRRSGNDQDRPSSLPPDFHAKLAHKRSELTAQFIQQHVTQWFQESGLFPIVAAKKKWDDVHYMAEAHGVGSSIPMVNYTDLSQTHVEWCLYSFYQHVHHLHNDDATETQYQYPCLDAALVKASAQEKQDLQKQIATTVCDTYEELYEAMTGEFGGYAPFANMVHHTPRHIRGLLGLVTLDDQELATTKIPLEHDGLEDRAKAERATLAEAALQQAQEYVAALKHRPPGGDPESSDDDYQIEDPSQRHQPDEEDVTEATAGEQDDEGAAITSFFGCFRDH